MKAHTESFKTNIKEFGRQIDCRITFTIDNEEITLTNEEINSVEPITQGDLLKAVMKELYIDSNVEIPKDTEINFEFGVFNYTNDEFEYINFGKYYVIKSEYQEDTRSYYITCYDKMITTMVDYTGIIMVYPTTIREYINELCQTLDITFANANDTFANYDKEMPSDLYSGLGYTYRDVLDELAQVTASTICINQNNELEIRYVHNVGEYSTATGTSFQIPNCDDGNDVSLTLKGDTSQYTTTGKNLYNVGTLTTKTDAHITFTPVYENGLLQYINANGTATANVFYNFSALTLPAGTYKMNGCTGGSTSTYQLTVRYGGSRKNSTNGDVEFTLSAEGTSAESFIRVANGTQLNNVKFYPMIRLSSITDDTYEPYTNGASPNPDYPQSINVVTGRQEIDICGKNLLPNNATSQTKNTIIFTKNSDGSVYANGTASALTQVSVYGTNSNPIPNFLPNGTYTLSGGIKTNQGVTIKVFKTNGNAYYASYGTDKTFTIDDTVTGIWVYLNIANGEQVDGTFYPMISTSGGTYEPYTSQNYKIDLPVENLIEPKLESAEYNGITCTRNNDGSYTLNGTATDNCDIRLDQSTRIGIDNLKTLKAGTYTLSCNDLASSLELCVMQNETWTKLLTMTGNTPVTQTIETSNNLFTNVYIPTGTELNNLVIHPMLEKGDKANQYTPYGTTPIELCKIGDYQDKILKSTGKNLFNSSIQAGTYASAVYTVDSGGKINQSASDGSPWEISAARNFTLSAGTYTFSIIGKNANTTFQVRNLTDNNDLILTTNNVTTVTLTDTKTLGLKTYGADEYFPQSYYIQIEKGTLSSDYEPYGTDWYIKKEIGSVTLDGTNVSFASKSGSTSNNQFSTQTISDIKKPSAGTVVSDIVSNYFISKAPNTIYANDTTGIGTNTNGTITCGFGLSSTLTTKELANTWLSTHNTEVKYVLSTPTYTKITDTNLIGQLEAVRLLNGLNNITITGSDLASPISITYLSERDTIDEEYLSEDNVKFGKKIGKINSIVLSRSAESDNVYLRDEESVTQNGLYEIKIVDNQIMNFNNRADFLPDILAKLDNLEYYSMDVLSTGICYYDICDRYNMFINGKNYLCVLMNDEININQGVEENIYVNDPEKSETEYKYADTTDKKINQAYIIVDKQNVQIQQLTQTTSNLTSTEQTHYQEMLSKMDEKASISDVTNVTNQVVALQTDTYTKTEINKIIDGTDENGLRVQVLQSTSAVLNEDGMTYDKTGAKTSSNINQAGFTVTDKDNSAELLFAGYDTQRQEALVRVANLYLTRFLGLDDWRIEIVNDSTNGKGLGFFYIG